MALNLYLTKSLFDFKLSKAKKYYYPNFIREHDYLESM